MHLRTFACSLVTAAAVNSSAQYPILGTSPESIDEVIYTVSSGKKLVHYGGGGAATVYDLDLGVFAQILPPTLMPPMTVSSIKYISQDLFDSDPSTVEYVLFYYEAIPGGHNGFKVLRTDGTVLFEAFPGTISGVAAPEVGIYNTPAGAVMAVLNNGQVLYTSTLYQLPGSLPCFDCSSGNIALAGPDVDRVSEDTGISLFPNPTNGTLTVRYSVLSGNGPSHVVIYGLDGAIIKRIPVSGSGSLTLTTADLAAGTYLCQLQSDQGRTGVKYLVVLR
jgi:hypothetical protein